MVSAPPRVTALCSFATFAFLTRIGGEDPNQNRQEIAEAIKALDEELQIPVVLVKRDNFIRRIGPDHGGRWEIVAVPEDAPSSPRASDEVTLNAVID